MYQAYDISQYNPCNGVNPSDVSWQLQADYCTIPDKPRVKRQAIKRLRKKQLYALTACLGFIMVLLAATANNLFFSIIIGGLGCLLFSKGLSPWRYSPY